MAQLDAAAEPRMLPWTAAQSRAQLVAIAWLRWRIFLNNFRSANKKRSVAGWALLIVVRMLVWSFIVGAFFLTPMAGSGLLAYYAVAKHHSALLETLTWAVFSINLFLSLNVMPGTVGFDLTPLMRFPVRFPIYLLIRLFFGLFAIPTLIANLCLATAAIGIGVAAPRLFPWAALALGIFALHNVFFIRMVLAWIDRWLATKRAREIFSVVTVFASLAFQLLIRSGRGHRGDGLMAMPHWLAPLSPAGKVLRPVLKDLPPSLAAGAVLARAQHATAPALLSLLGLAAFAALFLAIFAMRLKREFRGENLSEAGRRAQRAKKDAPRTAAARTAHPVALSATPERRGRLHLPPAIAACVRKELLYLKRSGAQLYGLVTPMFFVFIFTRTNHNLSHSSMLFPYAASYMMFGPLAGLYNVLGADGSGFNLYMLAPVRLRDVLLAKNLANGGVIFCEVLLALAAVSLMTGRLPPAAMLVATLLWAAFALAVNLTVGNLRSLLAPMRFELDKTRRTPVAKGGSLISLGVLFGTLATGIPVLLLCRHYGRIWLAPPIFLALDVAAAGAYLAVLARADAIAATHRDELTEALCRT